MTQCIECGSVRPDYSPRCACGSAHVAQACPNEETLTMEAALVYGPIAGERDVNRLREIRDKKRKLSDARHEPKPIWIWTRTPGGFWGRQRSDIVRSIEDTEIETRTTQPSFDHEDHHNQQE